MIVRFACAFAALALAVRADVTDAARYSSRFGETAFLVWHNGRVVLDRQSTGGNDAPIYSITKSLAALGTLRAAGRGILSLDEKVSATLATWRKDPRKQAITVRELLAQTSGLSPGYSLFYARGIRDKNALVGRVPALAPPGRRFAYGPSHYEALAALLSAKSPATDWLTLPCVDARPAFIRRDRNGQPFFSAGVRLNAHQLLAVGKLVYRKGRAGWISVIPARLIREALTGSPANAMYGLGFWLNTNARKPGAVERDVEDALGAGLGASEWARSCLSRSAPDDLVAMVGSRGQRVYIIPSRKLIIVRLGNSPAFRDPDFLRALF